MLSAIAHAQNCATREMLAPNGVVTGALNDSSCRLSDGTLYSEFRLTLPTVGQLQLTVSNDTIFLRDALGRKIDFASGARQTMERGVYSVLVNANKPDDSGPFTLTSAFTPEPRTLCRDFPALGLKQSAAGRLSAASCQLLDGTPFDGYLISTFGAGALDLSFDSDSGLAVILRTDDGRALDPDSIGPNRATFSVSADETYTLIVSGTGNYRVTTAFQPSPGETCRPKPLTANVQTRLAADACTFLSEGQELPYDYYEFKVSEAGQLDARLASSAFDPLIVLLDASGTEIDSDTISAALGSAQLRPQLAPGDYVILVVSRSPNGGDYNLRYAFQAGPPAVCPSLDLTPGTLITGALSSDSSCRTSDGIADTYRVTLSAAGTLEITMFSGEFTPRIVLRDAKDNRFFFDASGLDAKITADLPAGVYAISAGTTGQAGGYSLSAEFTEKPLPACPAPQKLNLNTGFIGILGPSSCHDSAALPVDYYEFTTPADGTAAMVMTSSDLDSYLTLEETGGTILRQDDNSFGGTDAILVQFLPARTYRIGAHSALPTLSAAYRLDLLYSLGDRPPGCTPIQDLTTNASVSAVLNYPSCEYSDGTFADLYRLKVSENSAVTITLAASFNPELLLLDNKGNLLNRDDNSISRNLDAGDYYVVAKSATDYVAGSYTVTVSVE